jgi:uncharacterized protein (DUF433 family)
VTLEDAVVREQETVSGALCFRGTRVPVKTLFDHLAQNRLADFYKDFPGVTPEMVEAVLNASEELLEDFVTLRRSA